MKQKLINESIKMVGFKVKDKVTGLEGVVTSICFDLYGCIQALVHPGVDKDGKLSETYWLDTNRLIIEGQKPIMEQPSFITRFDIETSIEEVTEPSGPESNKPTFN